MDVITLFTARSGSTYLSELLKAQGILGWSNEWLNPEFREVNYRAYGNVNSFEFIKKIKNDWTTSFGYFSIQVTAGHIINNNNKRDFDFFEYFRSAKFVYLRRKDILRQAISMALAEKRGIFHDFGSTMTELSDGSIFSDEVAVRALIDRTIHWIMHIMAEEQFNFFMLYKYNIKPLYVYYEELDSDLPNTVKRIYEHVGYMNQSERSLNGHELPKKLSNTLNEGLVRAFHEEHSDFLEMVRDVRAPLLQPWYKWVANRSISAVDGAGGVRPPSANNCSSESIAT